MDDVARKQFAEAVAASVSSVQHLYREVDRLIAVLRDAFLEEPDPFRVVPGTLRSSGKGSDRWVIRNEYALLFERSDDEDSDEEDKSEEPEDDGDDDDERDADSGGSGKKKPPVELASDDLYFVLRIALAEPRPSADFEPCLQYAVLGDWGLGSNGTRPKDGGPLTVRQNMLRKIPRILGARPDVTRRILTSVKVDLKGTGLSKSADRRLSCRLLGGVQTILLCELDAAAELDRKAAEIKKYWTEAKP
jgi:hypothetical protein